MSTYRLILLDLSQRLRRVLAGPPEAPNAPPPQDNTPWDGLIIHPDIHGESSIASLESLRGHLDLCVVSFDDKGAIEEECLRHLLDGDDGCRLFGFYDRDSTECGWYYSVYGTRQPRERIANSIASSLTTTDVHGRVLVVIDGPKGGEWQTSVALDIDRLARTVWWYRQSGNDVAEVFGERELKRFLSSLKRSS